MFSMTINFLMWSLMLILGEQNKEKKENCLQNDNRKIICDN